MHNTQITVTANSEMELLTKKMILEEIANTPIDELKRLHELSKIPKAKSYLQSAVKFAGLKALLK
jgi:hypothetical protein